MLPTELTPVRASDFPLPSKLDAKGSVFVGVVGPAGTVQWSVGKLDAPAPLSGSVGCPKPTEATSTEVEPLSCSSEATAVPHLETPSRWVEYENKGSEHLLREAVKFQSWGGHDIELRELRQYYTARFPTELDALERAEAEGREQYALWEQLDKLLLRFGPDSMEVLAVTDSLTSRWPFVNGKVRRKLDDARKRFERRSRDSQLAPSSVVGRGDHRITALKPSRHYIVLIDETGKNFGDSSGPEGKFVAVIAPQGVLSECRIHAVSATPQECDEVMQALLDKETAVLGVRLSDLPHLSGDRWYDGVLELLFWIARVIPLPGGREHVTIQVVIEQRGTAVAGDRWPEASKAIIRSLLAVDSGRAERLKIEIGVGGKDHPLLSYADVVAHAWSARSEDANSRLRKSRLLGSCLPSGDTKIVRDGWDSFGSSRVLSEKHWRGLLEHPDSDQELSLAGTLLCRAGESASDNLSVWKAYLDATRQHLESKRINLRLLSREVSWLKRWMPSGGGLPLEAEFIWTTTQLAEGNHHGAVKEELAYKLGKMGEQLFQESAPRLCWADLHRAVLHTNRFEFTKATEALARWKEEPPQVPGLQLWGRVQSSFGQHAAFLGQHATARKHFERAIEAFERLSDRDSAKLDIAQTAAYLAINEMDDPTTCIEASRAAIERVTGALELQIPKLATSTDRADQYVHHVLLRWLVVSQSASAGTLSPESSAYLATENDWGSEQGHPWPLILCYRAMLLPVGGKSRSLLEKAVELAWHDSQKGTVRLIGAAIAAIAESRGSVFHDYLDDELDALGEAIPAAKGRIEQLRDWRNMPGGELELLRSVLPFNFH
jgi:hypothetical protein